MARSQLVSTALPLVRSPRADLARAESLNGEFGLRQLFLIGHLPAQNFTNIGLRQIRSELDLLRDLVAGQLRGAELDDIISGDVRSLATTKAFTASPERTSLTPITTHSSTPGWLAIAFSTSFG